MNKREKKRHEKTLMRKSKIIYIVCNKLTRKLKNSQIILKISAFQKHLLLNWITFLIDSEDSLSFKYFPEI